MYSRMDDQDMIIKFKMIECQRKMDLVDQRVQNYINSTRYILTKANGQRITVAEQGASKEPSKGCEVFVGKIPRDMFEDELLPIFEKIGPILKFRLMVDYSGINRGYGFVTFFSRDHALTAVRVLHGYEVRKGRNIGVYKSTDNCRLFVGGIPTDKTTRDVWKALEEFVTGIVDVIMYSSHENKRLNRGFAFVEFEDHRKAAMARRKLAPGALIVWNVPLLVDWAEVLPDVDPSIMAQVTKLYLRNLDINISNETLLEAVMKLVDPKTVLKTHKILDYAFVHFTDRKAAETAFEALQDMKINGEEVEVMWARPREYSKKNQQESISNYCTSLPSRLRRQQSKQVTPPLPIRNRCQIIVPQAPPPLHHVRQEQCMPMRNVPNTPTILPPITHPGSLINHYDQRNIMYRMPTRLDYCSLAPPPNYYPANGPRITELSSNFNGLAISQKLHM